MRERHLVNRGYKASRAVASQGVSSSRPNDACLMCDSESYVAHLELPNDDDVFLITTGMVILFHSMNLKVEWDVRLSALKSIQKEVDGITLVLRNDSASRFTQESRFVRITEQRSVAFVFAQLTKYVLFRSEIID